MQLMDHVTDWRMLFGSVPQWELLMTIMLAVALGAAALVRLVPSTTPLQLRFLWYDRARVHQRCFMPLHCAFARGIVHPKIYA